MDTRLLDLSVCPVTNTSRTYKDQEQELWCRGSGLAYPIRDQMPVMLEDQARVLTAQEKASLD